MKKVLFIFFGFLVFSSIVVSKQTDTDMFVQKYLLPTVMIKSVSENSSGSGVIVFSEKFKNKDDFFNIVYSCSHILKEKDQLINVSNYDSNGIFKSYDTYKSIIFSKNDENDVSILLFLSDKKMAVANIDYNYTPKIKDEVFCIGHGLGDTARLSTGLITGATRKENSIEEIRTSVPIVFGDSGGPLFHKDKIIGISHAIKNAQSLQGINLPVYNISIFKSLKTCNKFAIDCNLLKNDNDFDVPDVFVRNMWIKKHIKILEN